jgi:FkbM family methyltransferase
MGVVYSLGVGCDIAFDLELIERFDVEVHAFDPTPSTAEWLRSQSAPPDFHFYPWAIGGHDRTMRLSPRLKRNGKRSEIMFHQVADDAPGNEGDIEVEAKRLPTIRRELGHETIDLLKMDIEGAEYEVLDDLLATSIRPTQLLIEFHHRHPGRNKSMTTDAIGRLGEAGYAIFSISSTGREFSFVRRDAAARYQEPSPPV